MTKSNWVKIKQRVLDIIADMKVECGGKRLIEFAFRERIVPDAKPAMEPHYRIGPAGIEYYFEEIPPTINMPVQIIGTGEVDLLELEFNSGGIGVISMAKLLPECIACKDLPQRECDLKTRLKGLLYK